MARAIARRLPFALGLSALGLSCSLAVDVEIECNQPVDCAGGDPVQTCSEQGLCEPASCEVDSDCSALGEGFENTVCEDGTCAPPQCDSDSQCQQELETETAICKAGRCQDSQWGCVGREDPREPEGDFASFEITLIDAITRQPVEPPSEVEVCEKNDPECDNALQVGIDYDADSGVLRLERMRQEFTGFIRIEGSNPGGARYMETRFFFVTRPLVNDEVAEDPMVLLTTQTMDRLSAEAGITDPPVDPERALFLSRIHDCQGELAEGVTLVSDDPGLADDRVLFYADEDFLPNQERSETFDTGAAGLANILTEGPNADRVIDMQTFVGDMRVADFTVNFKPGTVSHAYVYPGYE